MKLKLNGKERLINFVPEHTMDAFTLGRVFGGGKMRYTIRSVNQDLSEITLSVKDLWHYLANEKIIREP